VLLLLVMLLLATTELGTDSWISDIMRTVLASPTKGTLFLVWTQERTDSELLPGDEFQLRPSWEQLTKAEPNNIFLAKVTYYFTL